MSSLICDIVTPEARLYSEDAYMVIVPGVEGEMGYLEGHEPLISVLADGVVRVQKDKSDSEMKQFALQGGYVEVTGKKVIILANRAISGEEVDAEATKTELEEAERKLAELPAEEVSKSTLPADIEWCKMKIKASGN